MSENQILLLSVGGGVFLLLLVSRLLRARRRMRLFGETFREAMRKPNPIRNTVDVSDNEPTEEARRKTAKLKKRYRGEDDYDAWDY